MTVAYDYQHISKYVDDHLEEFKSLLKDAVAIPSCSANVAQRPEVIRMVKWFAGLLKDLGATVELVDLGTQVLEGQTIPLPPVILGHLGNDPSKKTLFIYGHLDVQPASKDDGWDTDPFVLTEKDGKMFGRGSTDDKGPTIGWICALRTFAALKMDLPVNLRFCFEGMEESFSVGLDELLHSRKETFFKDVDYVCISDSYWLGNVKPCLSYGTRGNIAFEIEVTCADRDLHSGLYGGCIHEAMTDLVHLMSSLVNPKGEITIDGIYDQVAEITEGERALYKSIDFDIESFKKSICANPLTGDKIKHLMSTWRNPSLSLHGIEGAFSEPGFKTVIPRKVIGKFSLRTVPHMEGERTIKLVKDHCEKVMKRLGSPNTMRVIAHTPGRYFLANPYHDNYSAAVAATKTVYGADPDLTRCGGSIPVLLTFEEVTGKNILLLPMGRDDDSAHSQNEKLDVSNFCNGIKQFCEYFHHLSKLDY